MKKILVVTLLFFFMISINSSFSYGEEEKEPAVKHYKIPRKQRTDNSKERIRVKGYYKTLAKVSEDYAEDDYYYSVLNRLRLTFDIGFTEHLSGRVTYDNEVTLGDILETSDFKTAKSASKGTFLDHDQEFIDNDDIFWEGSLHRAYLKYDRGPINLILGRQRISWSVARLWETVDYFSPVSPLSIEPDERVGTDAFDLEWKMWDSTRLEGVYAPQSRYKDSSLAARLSTLIGEYDLSFLGGKFRRDGAIAFTFDGNLMEGGLRGELSHVFADDREDFQRFDVGYDYTFQNSLYILFEYLYNGGATEGGSGAPTNQIATRNKHLLGLQLGYDITPLLRAEALIIYDPKDTSLLIMPTVEYSVVTNVDVMLGAQVFIGENDTEFGDLHNVYYSSLQCYF